MNIKNSLSLTMSVLFGLYLSPMLNFLGILNGQYGIDYYAEIHTSKFNSYIHTIFMPLTYMGFNIAIPALFNLSQQNATKLQLVVYIIYMVHFMTINLNFGIITACLYMFPLVMANDIYRIFDKNKRVYILIAMGFGLSVTTLVIQEILGHWYGGDAPSRPEGVFNAILYSMYYAVAHIFN